MAAEDKSGFVDYQEFLAFYAAMRTRMWGAELAHKKEVLIDAVLELGGEAVKLPDDA